MKSLFSSELIRQGNTSCHLVDRLTVGLILARLFCSLGLAQTNMGSGFIVHPDGYILSTEHVIRDSAKLEVVMADGLTRPAKVAASDSERDIALIKIAGSNLPTVILGDSDKMEVMDYVMAIGFPLSSVIGAEVSASEGKINAKRSAERDPLLQVDANVNPGSSGGPLVNERGEVIGIIVSKLSALRLLTERGFVPERISFAIPIKSSLYLLKKAYPFGVPQQLNRPKLESKAIFREIKSSVVLIVNYRTNEGSALADTSIDRNKRSETPNPDVSAGVTSDELVVLRTAMGDMVAELWPKAAPKTVENFKRLARQGFYDGTCFHRIIKGFMIQGGDPLTKDPSKEALWGTGDPGYKINAEFNDRKHVRGVLSMARGGDPDSAGCQFFICLGPAPFLDGKYTAFGKLVKGEDVLLKIGDTPCVVKGEPSPSKPTIRIGVESIKLVPPSSIK